MSDLTDAELHQLIDEVKAGGGGYDEYEAAVEAIYRLRDADDGVCWCSDDD